MHCRETIPPWNPRTVQNWGPTLNLIVKQKSRQLTFVYFPRSPRVRIFHQPLDAFTMAFARHHSCHCDTLLNLISHIKQFTGSPGITGQDRAAWKSKFLLFSVITFQLGQFTAWIHHQSDVTRPWCQLLPLHFAQKLIIFVGLCDSHQKAKVAIAIVPPQMDPCLV